MKIISCSQARQLDILAVEKYGVPSILLMENAGRGLADILSPFEPKKVVICCGKGNNGGDGFVVARHLLLRKINVQVYAMGNPEQYKNDALVNLRILNNMDVNIIYDNDRGIYQLQEHLNEADWVVDALLGTGTKGAPRFPYDRVIDQINLSDKKVLSVDIPSGLDGDTGEAATCCIKASITGTMAAIKTGLIKANSEVTGEIKVVDIGVRFDELL